MSVRVRSAVAMTAINSLFASHKLSVRLCCFLSTSASDLYSYKTTSKKHTALLSSNSLLSCFPPDAAVTASSTFKSAHIWVAAALIYTSQKLNDYCYALVIYSQRNLLFPKIWSLEITTALVATVIPLSYILKDKKKQA